MHKNKSNLLKLIKHFSEEIIREFELRRKVNFHENIVQFFGITNKESQNIQLRQYLLVMEYFNGGSLRNYLEEKFKDLTWENKYKLAHQLSSAVSYLHEKGIVHCDLHTSRRETMIPGTPTDYFNIYTECWDGKPNNRPTMDQKT
ncbi:unnamed protein product [Rhizophagus irregularis]|nr:unnamed protein product [Rhizophagus irregularis]